MQCLSSEFSGDFQDFTDSVQEGVTSYPEESLGKCLSEMEQFQPRVFVGYIF